MSYKNWETTVDIAMIARLEAYEKSPVEFLLIGAVWKCLTQVQKYQNLWESRPDGPRLTRLRTLNKLLFDSLVGSTKESCLRSLLKFLESPILLRPDLYWLIFYPYRSDLDHSDVSLTFMNEVTGDRNIFRNNLIYITQLVGEFVDECEKRIEPRHKLCAVELEKLKHKFLDLGNVLENFQVPVGWSIKTDLSV